MGFLELASKSVEVGFRISNLTLDLILKGLEVITEKLKEKPNEKTADIPATRGGADPELKHGKQTLKQLHKHNDGAVPIELSDPNVRLLKREMKKADIDFAIEKDGKGKYSLYFKGKDADEMTHAFKRYTAKVVDRANIQSEKKTARDEKQAQRTAARDERQAKRTAVRPEKKSIRQELKEAKEEAKTLNVRLEKVKDRSKGALGL